MSLKPYYAGRTVVIYRADCREVLQTMLPTDFGVLVTDPPYGVRYASRRTRNGKGASWAGAQVAGDDSVEVRDWVLSWAAGMPAAIFGTWRAPRPSGVRAVLVWDKGPAAGMGDLKMPWKPSWEEVYILGRQWVGRRDEGVLRGHRVVSWESRGRSHPNEKPVSLLEHIISKAPAGPVLDPFMGSGSTLVAAQRLGRPAIGIELEEKYCEVAARRLETLSQEAA